MSPDALKMHLTSNVSREELARISEHLAQCQSVVDAIRASSDPNAFGFSIGGGTPDQGEWDGVNWKYLDNAITLDEALAKYFMWAEDYPERELQYTAPSGIKVNLTVSIADESLAQFRQAKNRWNPSKEDTPLDAFTVLKD